MNKTLILEPSYSNFHCDLAHSLSSEVYSFVFNLGNLIYLKSSHKLIVEQKVKLYSYSLDDLYIAKNTKSLFTEKTRKHERIEPSETDFIYMARYIAFLRDFISEKKIDFVLMHNDLRWQHALAIHVCKELDIRYLITERGLFRPHTTTIDFQGVNAYSSIPKSIHFYEEVIVKNLPFKDYSIGRHKNFKVNLKFVLFLLLNYFGDIFKINTRIVNQRYSLLSYVSLFLKQRKKVKAKLTHALPKKYIFIPLQVNTDTQILVHSQYENMQAFISHVEKTFYAEQSDISLVFKQHPMDKGEEYKFDARSIISNNSTSQLIKDSEFIITINSTVGFEAIQHYKQVIVLGEAFYKIPKLCIASSINRFQKDLIICLNSKFQIDHGLVDKFIYYLKYKYQINGNLFNYDQEMLAKVQQLIENKKFK